jgi:hypothetical protein
MRATGIHGQDDTWEVVLEVRARVRHGCCSRASDQWTMARCPGTGHGEPRTDFRAGWADSGDEQWPGSIALRCACSCVSCLRDRARLCRVGGFQVFPLAGVTARGTGAWTARSLI